MVAVLLVLVVVPLPEVVKLQVVIIQMPVAIQVEKVHQMEEEL
jgi:hypothetical protein